MNRGGTPGWTSGNGFQKFVQTSNPGGNTLTFFTVTGYFYDLEQQNPNQNSISPQLLDVNGYVDFIPRLPQGFSIEVTNMIHGDGTQGDTFMPVAPITGRFINGALCSIAIGDPVGVGLLANSPNLTLATQLQQIGWSTTALIYDVRFRNVDFGGAPQILNNFAFYAPTTATTVSITSSVLQRIPYAGPS